MVMKTRDIGDADRFVIIRAFTRMPRDVAANLPDAVVGLRQVVTGRRSSIARPVFHDVIAASARSSAASPSSIVVLTGVPSRGS
ncbi:TPA: hypothetical protein RZC51_004137 [Burkholderia cenocepacia]|nr:hypothetical protein [Burkholderia cenocepacia]